MVHQSLFKINVEEKKKSIEKLIAASSPTQAFFLVLILSVIIATFGILLDNVAIVIGGMVVSPLLSPILAISLGIVLADSKLIYRSSKVLLLAMAWTIGLAFLLVVFVNGKEMNNEILSRIEPNLAYFGVALASGIAAAFAVAKEEFSERMIGVAVAIALLPPLAVIGIGIAFLNWAIVAGSSILFLSNLLGILLGSLIVFSLLGFYPVKKVAEKELKEEEKVLEKEKNGNNKK
ncbi:MAG TPA: TIGR00341 family protein [Candidatus Uhrbacteria bacterium]|nr:TIGR00341 family protein [Candidatus Uhrbacteria bacterium]